MTFIQKSDAEEGIGASLIFPGDPIQYVIIWEMRHQMVCSPALAHWALEFINAFNLSELPAVQHASALENPRPPSRLKLSTAELFRLLGD